jgi:hypothetical protein
MRGTITLNGTHAAGVTTLNLSQLVHTVIGGTADGSGNVTVTVEAPLRIQYAGGTAVTWDKAKAHFKLLNAAVQWRHYGTRLHQDFALDFLESWT